MGIYAIKLPDVGEGVAEAEFVELHVKPGDVIDVDQNLADVMTDKATVDVTSPRKGTVTWVGPQVGDIVAVGSEIFRIEIEGAGNVADDSEPTAITTAPEVETELPVEAAPAPAPAVTASATPAAAAGKGVHVIKLPDVGEGVAEAEFVELHVQPGDMVEPDQNLADVMTDKATVEVPSPRKGKVLWIGPAVGDVVSVGSEIFHLEVDGEGNSADVPLSAPVAVAAPKPVAEKPVAAPTPFPAPKPSAAPVPASLIAQPRSKPENDRPLASPAVRARARSRGVDLQFVYGTGPAGRITHEDLDAYIDGRAAAKLPGASPAGGTSYVADGTVEEVKVIGLRRKIAEKMQESKRRIPHITYVEEVDVTALEDLRAHMNATRGSKPKLTILPFLMRAMVLALKKFPEVNARFDDDNGIVHRHGGAHIGIATQTDNGLMVPVVRHAEANDVWQNAAEVARLAQAGRCGSAKREELSGSTITITSLGAMGGLVTTPVINHPEVAIVGVNKIQTLPRYDAHGHVVPKKLMNLSSGFDHRIIDGWVAAEFVQAIRAHLEHPATLFI